MHEQDVKMFYQCKTKAPTAWIRKCEKKSKTLKTRQKYSILLPKFRHKTMGLRSQRFFFPATM